MAGWARRRALLFAVLAGELAASGSWQPGLAAEIRFVCRNPSSGTTWEIKVDDQRLRASSVSGVLELLARVREEDDKAVREQNAGK